MVLGTLPAHMTPHVQPSPSTSDGVGTDQHAGWPMWARALWCLLDLLRKVLESTMNFMEAAFYWHGLLYTF